MKTAKLFRDGQSQVVSLPKEFRMDGESVFIKKVGRAVVLIPRVNAWGSLIESLAKSSPDFMNDRQQPASQTRGERLGFRD